MVVVAEVKICVIVLWLRKQRRPGIFHKVGVHPIVSNVPVTQEIAEERQVGLDSIDLEITKGAVGTAQGVCIVAARHRGDDLRE